MSKSVHDIMTSHPHTVFVTDSVESAYRKLKQYHVRHLPVVDGQGKLVGIMSERDFQRIMIREKSGVGEETYSFDSREIVEDVMSWPVQAIGEGTPIKTAARLMLQDKLSALVITSFENRPKGIVTTDDFLHYLIELDAKELDRPINLVIPSLRL